MRKRDYTPAANDLPLPEAAVRDARLVPVKYYGSEHIMMYDLFIGKRWYGSRHSLVAAKSYMMAILKAKGA